MEKEITLNINEKLIYESCLKDKMDDEHVNEWRRVARLPLNDEVWDKLVIELCKIGKGEDLTEAEMDYLINLMLPECHD